MNTREIRIRLAGLGWNEERLASVAGVPASSVRLLLQGERAVDCSAIERALSAGEASEKRRRLDRIIHERELIRHARA